MPSSAGGVPADPPPSDPRMPGLAMAAGAVGILGALPPGLLAVIAVSLGGLSVDPWAWLLVAIPVLQVAAAGWLVARRGWLPLVLAVLPVAAFVAAVVATAAASEEPAGGLGFPLLLLVLPVVAAVLAATPRVRRWIAGRPRRGR